MNDEAVIRKLIADGDGTNDDKRIVQLISLIKALCSDTEKDPKLIAHKMLNSLDQIELSIKKQCLISDVLETDTKNNEELFVNIDAFIDKETERMKIVKNDLTMAKAVRKNRQEYDSLAKLIMECPSKAEIFQALQQMQVELDVDQERQKVLEQKLAEKKRNIYSLALLLKNLDGNDSESDESVLEIHEVT